MVTIEQKLMLFENLIQHNIFEKAKAEKYKKEQYYENLILENKNEMDKISQEMKIEEKQRLDRIYLKEEAQIKKTYENSFLKTKEELLNKVLNKIEEELMLFTRTDEYKNYMDITINKVFNEIDFDKDIILGMTEKDIQIYGDYIREQVGKNNKNMEIDRKVVINQDIENILKEDKTDVDNKYNDVNVDNKEIDIKLNTERDSVIGGIIIKTADGSMRYDFSLRRDLEENMRVILKSLNAIIEEGEKV